MRIIRFEIRFNRNNRMGILDLVRIQVSFGSSNECSKDERKGRCSKDERKGNNHSF